VLSTGWPYLKARSVHASRPTVRSTWQANESVYVGALEVGIRSWDLRNYLKAKGPCHITIFRRFHRWRESAPRTSGLQFETSMNPMLEFLVDFNLRTYLARKKVPSLLETNREDSVKGHNQLLHQRNTLLIWHKGLLKATACGLRQKIIIYIELEVKKHDLGRWSET